MTLLVVCVLVGFTSSNVEVTSGVACCDATRPATLCVVADWTRYPQFFGRGLVIIALPIGEMNMVDWANTDGLCPEVLVQSAPMLLCSPHPQLGQSCLPLTPLRQQLTAITGPFGGTSWLLCCVNRAESLVFFVPAWFCCPCPASPFSHWCTYRKVYNHTYLPVKRRLAIFSDTHL
jgi:hypothetical protein